MLITYIALKWCSVINTMLIIEQKLTMCYKIVCHCMGINLYGLQICSFSCPSGRKVIWLKDFLIFFVKLTKRCGCLRLSFHELTPHSESQKLIKVKKMIFALSRKWVANFRLLCREIELFLKCKSYIFTF